MASTSSAYFPLATEQPYTGGQDPATGTANSGPGSGDGTIEGASGTSDGSVQISRGALVAIIIVVVIIAILGISTSVLFYVAKKREWTIKETLRRSARKVVTALTPRRSEFPKSVKESSGRSRGGRGMKLNDVPPTPRIKPEHLELDLEKGANTTRPKRGNFSRK
ncbi:hypothetical protein GQ53DRAFT_712806 [Thozetella sp. PMI_491]|nr:hypothetical protein GQ53DRAFT_712806 [Thozetella sp. PMI_491]